VASQDQTAGTRAYVDGQEPSMVGEPSVLDPAAIDPGAIMSSVGEVAYEWRLDTDTIAWGTNVGAVLPIRDAAAIASGRSLKCPATSR